MNCKAPQPIDDGDATIVELIQLAARHDWNWMYAETGAKKAQEEKVAMQRLGNRSPDAARVLRAVHFWHNSTPPEIARGDHEQRWRSLLRDHKYHEYALGPGVCSHCTRRVGYLKQEIAWAHAELGRESWAYLAALAVAGRDVMWNPATRAGGFFPMPRGLPSY